MLADFKLNLRLVLMTAGTAWHTVPAYGNIYYRHRNLTQAKTCLLKKTRQLLSARVWQFVKIRLT